MSDMSDKNTVVIASPEELGRVDTRRSFLRMLGMGGSIVLLPSVFAACGDDDGGPFAVPGTRTGGGAGATGGVVLNLNTDTGILNYAYALEQLEAAFYTAVTTASNYATLFPSADEREVLSDITVDEVTHREFLKAAIPANGGTLIGNLAVNFASVLTSRATILATARSFEDLGVAAYNGAGKYLTNATFLTLAGKIVSVEARHAAAIRDVLDTTGTQFANVSDIADFGANNATGLDAALEPSAVLTRVRATGTVTTNITIGTSPVAPTA
jgi:rubrerythrin